MGFLAVLAIALSGCGRSPANTYYTLTAPTSNATTDAKTAKAAVRVGPVFLASYLNRPQIVTRTGDNQFVIDDYARWAEPLNKAIQRNVAINLGREMPDHFVYEFGVGNNVVNSTTWLVPIDIRRFDVDAAGNAVVELQWGTEGMVSNTVVAARTAVYNAKTNPDDYSAQARTLSKLLADFSADLANSLAALPADEAPSQSSGQSEAE